MDNFLDSEGNTPLFQIIFAFTIGVALSPFNRGILFLVIFALGFELIYAYRSKFKYHYDVTLLRSGLFFYSFFGFLIGRSLCCNDWNPIRGIYEEDENHAKNRFDDHNEGCINRHEDDWE